MMLVRRALSETWDTSGFLTLDSHKFDHSAANLAATLEPETVERTGTWQKVTDFIQLSNTDEF